MDRFEYVMVLISIIVGLSIAHVLLGVGGIIDRRAGGRQIRPGWAHGLWLAYVFVWLVQFWWWEFRFSEFVTEWTLGLYLFLVTYTITLFLLSVVLVPRTWDGVDDLDAFFLQRRRWFYWILVVATSLDVVDALLKGGFAYVEELGFTIWLVWGVAAVACVVGLTSERLRHHRATGAAIFLAQIVQAVDDTATLGF